MNELFHELMRDLSVLLSCAPPELDGDAHGVRLEVEDVEFVIAHDKAPANLLSICCKLGSLPPDAASDRLLRMLEMNLVLAGSCAGAIGVDSVTQDLIYVFHAPLRGLAASDLLQALLHMVRQAHAWRESEAAEGMPSLGREPEPHATLA